MTLAMPVEPEANELLSRSPLALLIGMVLDQQVPLERAFSAPLDLVRRLGHEPTAAELADFDPVALAGIFSERPALHRYPRAMAARVQEVARLIVDQYDGEPDRLWTTAKTGDELLKRVSALPGFGAQKAQIFVPCSASSSGCGLGAGGRRRGRSGPRARTCRSRTSPARTHWPRCAPISRS